MGETRISRLAAPVLVRGRSLFSGRLFERLRHVLWAALISLALYAVFLLQPIDQFLWLFQSRVADRNPTGDVVFVSSNEALNDTDNPPTLAWLERLQIWVLGYPSSIGY